MLENGAQTVIAEFAMTKANSFCQSCSLIVNQVLFRQACSLSNSPPHFQINKPAAKKQTRERCVSIPTPLLLSCVLTFALARYLQYKNSQQKYSTFKVLRVVQERAIL